MPEEPRLGGSLSACLRRKVDLDCIELRIGMMPL